MTPDKQNTSLVERISGRTKPALRRWASAFLAAAVLASPVAIPQVASAQGTLADEEGIRAQLRAQGYRQLKVVQRRFSLVNFEGCRGERKYLVKVNLLGIVTSRTDLGACPTAFSLEQAVAAMRKDGYSEIDARRDGRRFIGNGCRNGRIDDVIFNRRGKIISRERVGRCGGPAKTPNQIIADLRKRAILRVKFTDDKLPRYVAEACIAQDRVELVMNRRGDIRSQRRIGSCPEYVSPRNMAAIAGKLGYRNVRVTQGSRAPYVSEACIRDDKVQIVITRYGDLQAEKKIGSCPRPRQPVNVAQVRNILKDKGYRQPRLIGARKAPFLMEACKGRELYEVTVARFGGIRKEEVVGRCDGKPKPSSVTTAKLLETLESRGASDLELFVEGCFRNRRYRWSFDRQGERQGRDRLPGSC